MFPKPYFLHAFRENLQPRRRSRRALARPNQARTTAKTQGFENLLIKTLVKNQGSAVFFPRARVLILLVSTPAEKKPEFFFHLFRSFFSTFALEEQVLKWPEMVFFFLFTRNSGKKTQTRAKKPRAGLNFGVPKPPGLNFGAPRLRGAQFRRSKLPWLSFGVPRPPGLNFGVTRPPRLNFGVPRLRGSISMSFSFGGSFVPLSTDGYPESS